LTWPDSKPWWYPRERRSHTWTSEGLRWRTVENASYGTLNARRIFFIRLRCQLAPGSGAAGELGPGQDIPPGRFSDHYRSDHYRYVVHGPHSLLWIRPRTNSFIGSIGKSAPSTYHGLAVSGMIPVYSVRDVPGPYPPTVTPPCFFVSVHSTGLSTSISHLFSTLTRGSQVLILKEVTLYKNCASPGAVVGEGGQ